MTVHASRKQTHEQSPVVSPVRTDRVSKPAAARLQSGVCQLFAALVMLAVMSAPQVASSAENGPDARVAREVQGLRAILTGENARRLEEGHQAWLRYRDSRCSVEEGLYRQGDRQGGAHGGGCFARLDKERAAQLNSLRIVALWNTAGAGHPAPSPGARIARFQGNGGQSTAIAAAADGSVIATGHESGLITITSGAGEQLRQWKAYDMRVARLVLSRNGRLLVSAPTFETTIKIWDVESGEILRTFATPHPRALALTGNGRILAYSSSSDLKLVDLLHNRHASVTYATEGGIMSLAFSADGGYLAAGTTGGLQLWRVDHAADDGDVRLTTVGKVQPYGLKEWVTGLAFTPDGKHLLTTTRSGNLARWDLADLGLVRLMRPQDPWIGDLALSRNGRTALLGTVSDRRGIGPGSITIKNLDTGSERRFGGLSNHPRVAMLEDGTTLLVSDSWNVFTLDSGSSRFVKSKQGAHASSDTRVQASSSTAGNAASALELLRPATPARGDHAEGAAPTKSHPWREALPPDAASAEVHYVGVHKAADGRKVLVNVTLEGRPIVLVATAYNSIEWELAVRQGVDVKAVIISGYKPSTVTGVPEGVRVLNFTGESRGEGFYSQLRHLDDYLYAMERLQSLLGVSPGTLQGEHKTGEFNVDGKLSKAFDLQPKLKGEGGVRLLSSRPGREGIISADGFEVAYCCAGAFSTVRANRSYMSGRWYLEARLKSPRSRTSRWTAVGVVTTSIDRPHLHGSSSNSRTPSYSLPSGQLSDGDTIGIAIDVDNGRLYFSKNGVWIVGDPNGRQGGIAMKPKRDYVAAFAVSSPGRSNDSDTWTVNFGAERFAFDVPAGYAPYAAGALAP